MPLAIGAIFKRLFSPGPKQEARLHPDEEAINDEVLKLLPMGARRTVRYPPFLEGYPAFLSSDYLLGLQHELTNKMLGGVGLTKADFDDIVKPVMVNYARFVHLLPASENHHHCGPGGLLRHGLEVAFYAMNCTKNTAFDSRLPPSQRSFRAFRWNVAGMLCGLLHDTGKAVTDMHVLYQPTNLKWVYSEGSIEDWAKKHDLRKYYIEWQKGRQMRHVPKSRDLVMTLYPPRTLAWLSEGGEDILDALLDAIVGNEESPLHRALMLADGKSTKLDMATGESPQYMTGVPIIKLITGAMTRLIKDGKWECNKPGARVWTTTEGVFIAWNSGATEIIDLILSDQVEAIPRTATSLLMRLIDQSVAERSPDGEMYWEVAPDCLQKNAKPDKPMILRCMKLVSAETLFPYDPVPSPVSVRVRLDGEMVPYRIPSEAEATSASVDEPLEPVAESETDQNAPPKKKKKQKGHSKPKPRTTDSPILVETDEPAEPDAIAVPGDEDIEQGGSATKDSHDDDIELDPVLERMANLVVSGSDPESRQVFLTEALGCWTDQQQPTESAAQQPEVITEVEASDDNVKELPESVPASTTPPAAPKRFMLTEPKQKPRRKTAKSTTAQQTSIPLFQYQDELDITPEEKTLLGANPELASELIRTLQTPEVFSAFQRRVFIPVQSAQPGGLDDALVESLIAAGWLWSDFTAEQKNYIYNSARKDGVVLVDWLGEFVTRNISSPPAVSTSAVMQTESCETFLKISNALVQGGAAITIGAGTEAISVSMHKIKQIAKEHGVTREDAVNALHLHHEAVYDWRKKVVYIRPVEGDNDLVNNNG